MRLLLDQDVYALTVRFLKEMGHDAVTAAEMGYSRASDAEMLDLAEQEGRILVTRDRDFGSLVFVRRQGSGVIYLRMTPSSVADVHAELLRVLASHSEMELRSAFVVVETGRHRFRHRPT